MIRIATVWRARGELRFLPLWAKTVTEAAFPLRCRDGGRRGTSLTEGLLISPAPLPPSSGARKRFLVFQGSRKNRVSEFFGEKRKSVVLPAEEISGAREERMINTAGFPARSALSFGAALFACGRFHGAGEGRRQIAGFSGASLRRASPLPERSAQIY